MKTDDFYDLSAPESTTKRGEWAANMDFESTIICPINDGHQRPGKRTPTLSVVLPRGPVDDVVWTWFSECLLTDRALELFKSRGLRGFEVKPVKTAFNGGVAKAPRLWELVVTGWAGMAPPESGIRLIKHCSACGHKVYSAWTNAERLIVPSQWDGSDLFMVWPLPRHIFVTERVAQVIRDNGLSGVVLSPVASVVFPASVIPGLSPGRLSYWMPDARARELGEPLGIY